MDSLFVLIENIFAYKWMQKNQVGLIDVSTMNKITSATYMI